jgi:hypothetical protein
MGSILRGISPTIFFSREEIRSFRKNARWKTTSRRSTDRRNRGLNLSNLWPWRRFCLDSRFFTDLGRRQIKIDASIALRLASSVNRRVWFDPNLEHPEKYAGRWFQPVQQRHFFFAPGCRNRESRAAALLVPCATPGAGLFVGGSRFVEAVACIGPAVGPLRARGPCAACCVEP